ncbi:MAG: YchJ family protein [Bdellovibrionia bacterium]
MSDTNLCPCGSKLKLEQCCLPIIRGKKSAETAEELLRARYTAFTLHEIDFILSSHHSRTRDEVKREEIEQWAQNSTWLGLQIVQTEAGKKEDSTGTLIFSAHYEEQGKKQEHWEKSIFEKEDGQWKFLDAQGIHTGTYQRSEPKIGRNDLCPCGSTKKYKKCCGK